MSLGSLSSRAIIGRFYNRLNVTLATSWAGRIAMTFQTDQPSEEYRWLGMPPSMREWVGGRQAKRLRDQGMIIRNKKYEASLEIPRDDLRRDKTGQIMVRVDELADRAAEHWAKLLTQLIVDNGNAYDSIAFFGDAHTEGLSGTQDNNLAYNVATPAAPTAAEMEAAILQAVVALLGIKDDEGEPMATNAMQFMVMVPLNMMAATLTALSLPVIVDGSASRTSVLPNFPFSIRPVWNPRLTATDVFYVFREDSPTKPFILQEEVPTTVKALTDGSDYAHINDAHLYSVDALRAAGYGMWQHANKTTLT